jgi:hypothetical protein
MQLIHPATLGDPLLRSKALEEGNILFFPQTPFVFSDADRQSLLAAVQTNSDLHKNISYRPKQGKISGLGKDAAPQMEKVRASLSRFSEAATRFAAGLLPHYAAAWRLDYASFRGIEEEGRDLSWKKRNDLLHTDAFPTRPTNGDLILRFFVNINPSRERVWMTSDPFEITAGAYAADAGLARIAGQSSSAAGAWKRIAHAVGLPVPDRSKYDEFMLGFHDYLKGNEAFQRDCAKYRFHFPPNSAWMVFTDVVPHAVLSGQFAVEQTFIIAKESLAAPELAPARILERLSGRSLTR